MPKITFIMGQPSEKKHSVQFKFRELDGGASAPTSGFSDSTAQDALRNCAFYIPRPLFEKSKKIRVTIEEVEG